MRKLTDDEHRFDLVDRAAKVAQLAHEGQTRKYTGEPYYVHCQAVAGLVADRYQDPFMTAAAYLHDTIEDTSVTEQWLRCYFPCVVVDLVVGLTDVYTSEAFPTWNRTKRKFHECMRYNGECAKVQQIKVCDLIDNTKSIIEHDPKFSILYLREKADLLASFRPEVLK